ncbi:hypothetical protein O1611_g4263 [Lasiodiplodia mahajangana]|uniref:Uncharacterized protein n=1 Tax=Lasiodiplodia mahajangana TaxID=1108764 RepID=A0ACC2JQ99_9PEZI|nr:hypothetical protein O1611_g4263 [Lasiodiplodia mahajangana]
MKAAVTLPSPPSLALPSCYAALRRLGKQQKRLAKPPKVEMRSISIFTVFKKWQFYQQGIITATPIMSAAESDGTMAPIAPETGGGDPILMPLSKLPAGVGEDGKGELELPVLDPLGIGAPLAVGVSVSLSETNCDEVSTGKISDVGSGSAVHSGSDADSCSVGSSLEVDSGVRLGSGVDVVGGVTSSVDVGQGPGVPP